eukprot:m.774329 g.774329  ORF g.774329 m.774329 type:complete len:211 (+) comp23255_c0_seq17:208-840(+)
MGDCAGPFITIGRCEGWICECFTPELRCAEQVTAVTKCDDNGWCNEWETFNATMTREGFTSGTYSHPWGTAAVPAIVNGIMGITQTSPGYATFTVRPKLASIASATVVIPTLRGFINVSASAGRVELRLPCNTIATSVCVGVPLLPASSPRTQRAVVMLLDGEVVASTTAADAPATAAVQQHMAPVRQLCVASIGCGVGDTARVAQVRVV